MRRRRVDGMKIRLDWDEREREKVKEMGREIKEWRELSDDEKESRWETEKDL